MSDPGDLVGATQVEIAGGVVVSVPASLSLMTPFVLREQEDWFEDEIGFLRRRLEPGSRVLDIGANYGLYALALARVIGASGRLWAVEPASATLAHLRRSVAINGFDNVVVVATALSDRAGAAQLSVHPNAELNSLSAELPEGTRLEQVALTTLDALAGNLRVVDLDFLKLDAEGEEERIVSGGSRLLAGQSPLVMYELKHGEQVNLGLIDQFGRLGYATYRLVPGLDVLVPFDPATEQGDDYQLNLFCAKHDRRDRLARAGLLADQPGRRAAALAADHRQAFEVLAGRPYAAELMPGWRAADAGSPGAREHAAALGLYGLAHRRDLGPGTRVAALSQACDLLRSLCERDDRMRVFRLCSLARVLHEAGLRGAAVEATGRALDEIGHADAPPPLEQFLAPGEAFDEITPRGQLRDWLLAALGDQRIRLAAFSTYFAADQLMPLLEMVRQTGFQRPEMERRRQLVLLASGGQQEPEPVPALTAYGPANRNPAFWRGEPG